METILFLCPHNAAKGIMAEAYFNQLAQQNGLPFQADSAGTDPSLAIWPTVVALLAHAQVPLTSQTPRQVTREDLLHAFRVISMGCAPEELEEPPQSFMAWEDIPLASTDLPGSWAAIRRHVEQMVAELVQGQEATIPAQIQRDSSSACSDR